MFCKNCGKQTRHGRHLCSSCRQPVKGMFRCVRCLRVLDAQEFFNQANKSDGKRPYCIECKRADNHKRAQKAKRLALTQTERRLIKRVTNRLIDKRIPDTLDYTHFNSGLKSLFRGIIKKAAQDYLAQSESTAIWETADKFLHDKKLLNQVCEAADISVHT